MEDGTRAASRADVGGFAMRDVGKPLILAVALLLTAPGGVRAQGQAAPRDFILRGLGAAMPCAEWTELRIAAGGLFARQKSESYRTTVGWVLGYLSGAARFGEDLDPLRRTNEEEAIAWVAEYCEAHPGTMLRLAAEAFIDTHPPR